MGLKYRPKAARPEVAFSVPQALAPRKAAFLISSMVSSGFSYFWYLREHSQKQLCLTSVMVWNGQGAITTAISTCPGEVHSHSVPQALLESRAVVGCGLQGHEAT